MSSERTTSESPSALRPNHRETRLHFHFACGGLNTQKEGLSNMTDATDSRGVALRATNSRAESSRGANAPETDSLGGSDVQR